MNDPAPIHVRVTFYSYFKDLAGYAGTDLELPAGSSVADLLLRTFDKFPQLAPMAKSTLVAVGLEYRTKNDLLTDGDDVSLFPPVQGG
jgi:molybdopterin converting factor small subunit